MPAKPSIDWQRIYALPYNHYFKDWVKKVRLYLNIPTDGIRDSKQAWIWVENHLSQKKLVLTNIPPWLQQLQPQIEEKLWKTDVPLWKCAIFFIYKFGLPLRMRSSIGLYVVTDNERFLTNWKGLDVIVEPNSKAGQLQFNVAVDGIDPWTTKEEWLEVWEDWVKTIQSLVEPIPLGKRTGRGKKLQEQIKRWSEWYELSETQGLGPANALQKWDELHPEYVEHQKSKEPYDESTVTKAVEEFRRLITPTNS